ncbi:MAG: hypothetical protein RL095_4201 [Verrucomicrobiota bacterium]|jgi:hypothetical protein
MGSFKMRISFDLDDTLINPRSPWACEPQAPPLLRSGTEERLRYGTMPLFQELRRQGHEIWIYTNSYRGWFDIENWFSQCGIPVDKAINQVRHDEARMLHDPKFKGQKNPTWFSIDVHVDDSQEIFDCGLQFGFRVLVVDPRDYNWVDKLLREIRAPYNA